MSAMLLKAGKHRTRAQGTCIMEAISWAVGEPHTDAPRCVTVPELRVIAMRLNDAEWASDEARTEALRPYMVSMIQATATDAQRVAIRFRLADIAVREIMPEWRERHGRRADAEILRGLSEIVDATTARCAADALGLDGCESVYAYSSVVFALSRLTETGSTKSAVEAALRISENDQERLRWTRRLLDAALALCGTKGAR